MCLIYFFAIASSHWRFTSVYLLQFDFLVSSIYITETNDYMLFVNNIYIYIYINLLYAR